MINVVFVYPDLSIGARGKFYHGIAYLSACLKKAGHRVSLIHIYRPFSDEEFIDALRCRKFDLVAFSATTNMFPYVKKYAKITKNHFFRVPTICGGIHSSLVPDEVISDPNIDMVCIGEGEGPLVDLCNKMENNENICDISNLWLKIHGRICRNKLRPFEENLDKFPLPDRELFDYDNLEDARMKREVFMASRGCPCNCTYCCNHYLRNLTSGRYVRFRSVENIIEEIESVITGKSLNYIAFHDDIFTLNQKWLWKFCTKYRETIKLPFTCNSRVDLLNASIIKMLKESGCFNISMGIESGNESLRNKILNRRITDKQIIMAFDLCKKFGVETTSYNMIGLPFEDIGRMLDTVKLNAFVRPNRIQVSIFYPYPRTEIYEVCRRENLLTGLTSDSIFEDSTLLLPKRIRCQIKQISENFRRLTKLYGILLNLPICISKILTYILQKLFSSTNIFAFVLKKVFFGVLGSISKLRRLLVAKS